MSLLRPTFDGVVLIRPPEPADVATLVAGRDEQSRRFIGPGSPNPAPTACIVVDGTVVGWVDYDHDSDRDWLEPGEVNVGYNVFPAHRGRGHATRAVQLLLHHLAVATDVRTASLLIDPANVASLALAARARFAEAASHDGNRYFRRAVPPLEYSDGTVTIRRQRPDDIDADLEAKDDEQIDWLWLPGQRESWESMSPAEQRAHAERHLAANRAAFGSGPKWSFAVDGPDADYVAYVDCDLANDDVPRGEANVSYSSHPAHRGRGYVSRAVRLILCFLADHTATRRAHIVVDAENVASLRVAAAVGAAPVGSWVNDRGRTMIRHVRDL